MTEKQMQGFFGKWVRQNPPKVTTAWELKYTKGNRISFDAVQPHQEANLLATKNNFFYHKITDPPVFAGMNTRTNIKRPYDCFCIVKGEAYVVVWFYKPRKPKVFIQIDINVFIDFRDNHSMKSFTEEEALSIGKPLKIT